MSRRTLTPDALTVQVLMDLGRTLDALRMAHGLSISAFAIKSGVGENTVGRVLNVRDDAQISTVILMAEAVGYRLVLVPSSPSTTG